MYRTFDEEIFRTPESIISGLLATAAYADDSELPDIGPVPQSWHAVSAQSDAGDADTDTDADADADADADGPALVRADVDPIETWSRRARGTSGFGG